MKKKDKICIIRSKYNDTSKLLKSATKELTRRKISYVVIEVPGAFEIPVTIVRNINKYVGFIAIGSIIKGKHLTLILYQRQLQTGLCKYLFCIKNQLEMLCLPV